MKKTHIVCLNVCFILAILFCSCEANYDMQKSTYFENKDDQLEFISALRLAGIAFRVEGNDVWYGISDSNKVKEIKIKLWPELAYLGHVAIFYEKKLAEKFMLALDRADIRSELFNRNGKYLVGWSEKDDPAVRKVYSKFDKGKADQW